MPVYLTPPPRSPVARAVAAVVGALVLIGSFMVGIVAFLILLGVSLVGGIWFWFRTRDLRRAMAEAADAQGTASGEYIEAEYSVVEDREPARD